MNYDIPNDGFGNWCPDCGERRDLCQCEDDPEQDMIDDYYERLAQKEFDKWELQTYWNV